MTRARRRKLNFVDLHTNDQPDPVLRFCIECSPIFTLYTHGLHASSEKIRATASWMRIFPKVAHSEQLYPGWVDLGNGVQMVSDEPPDNFGLSETLNVLVDESLLAAAPQDRAERYLGWLHSVLCKAAKWRNWDEQPLRNARQFCIDRGLKAHFDSPVRQSPDRKHKAVLSLDIDEDGWRHLTITIRDRGGQVVAVSAQKFRPFALDFYTWRSTRNQFRWVSAVEALAPNDRAIFGPESTARGVISAVVGQRRGDVEDPEPVWASERVAKPVDWLVREIEEGRNWR